KGGLNMSTVTGNDIDNPKLHPSFHIGGFANFMIAEKIAIQPELLFSGKGSKSDLQGTYKLGYAQIPILVQYVDQSGFYAEVGPQAGLLMSAKLKNSGGSGDVKSQFKSPDFSWVAGLGYKMANGFGIGARYDFGYYNVANSGIIRNKTIMISILYTFGSTAE
ncbi:MAG: porin family protein, partial [Bacteroidota bacterium]